MSFHVGQTFGNYSITAMVGAGSMGRVYKVEHALTGRTEAMKVLSTELASEIQFRRFEREMRSLSKLSHPNIAALHNAVHFDDQLILLMEFIIGETLEAMFEAGRLPLEEGVAYIKQVLCALAYAHHQGVVHRDISPANVMVMPDGQVKLTDFGLSKSYGDSLLTNCGEILGSLPYMAPEQVKGTTQPDRRSDLYSVGAMLYEHLTGQKPFGEKRKLSAMLTDREDDPKPPSEVQPGLAAEWDEILRCALARNPAHRYKSAEEFLEAIAQLERPAIPELPLPRLGKLAAGVVLFASVVLALIGWPGLERFYHTPPVRTPWERLHIAAPALSLVKSKMQHATVASHRRVKPIAKPVVAEASPAVADSPVVAPQPQVQQPPTAVAAPVATRAATALAKPATTPAITQAVDVAPVPAKRGFWNKLNVFHKKRGSETQTQ